MFDEDDSALNADDQAAADTAGGESTDTDDTATDVTGDDTTGADDNGEENGEHDQETTTDKAKQMIPKDRFDEVIGERNTARQQAERLQGQVEFLAQMVTKQQTGAQVTEKQQDKAQDALDALISSGEIKKEEATKLQRIIDAMGYKRGDAGNSEVAELKKQVNSLQKLLGDKADRDEKDTALKSFGDIVTEDELDTVIRDWASSKNPDRRNAAQNWSYEDIIKVAFHDKIIQSEVDKALKGKKQPAPKIDKKGGDKVPKKPSQDEFEWDPGNGETSMEALKRSLLVDVASDGE